MSSLTLDVGELRKRWMELYVNFMVLRSTDPRGEKLLEGFKHWLAEMNEKAMAFFDALEEPMEAEG